ncbi:MAG: inositol monophosphatase family protein [Candidatus Anstonellales archaeon]
MEYLERAKIIARKAGDLLKKYFDMHVKEEEKGIRDIVTKADKESEQIIKKEIKKYFPRHSILAEESGAHYIDKDYLWVIDPLDGTANFVHHVPFFNVSIALKYRKDTICAVVYNPILNEMFYAKNNGFSYLNGKIIKPSYNDEIKRAFLGTCHSNNDKSIRRFINLLSVLKYKTRDIRKFGSAALEICYVASGRFNAFIGIDVKPWDVSAALLIAKNAGCKIRSMFNEKDNNVFVSSPAIYKKLNRIIRGVEKNDK